MARRFQKFLLGAELNKLNLVLFDEPPVVAIGTYCNLVTARRHRDGEAQQWVYISMAAEGDK